MADEELKIASAEDGKKDDADGARGSVASVNDQATDDLHDGLTTLGKSKHDSLFGGDSTTSKYNGPMLINWVYKNLEDELTVDKGLQAILKHMDTGEACEIFLRHSIIDIVVRVTKRWRTQEYARVQLSCVSIIRRLLDCNFTRDSLISSPAVMMMAFNAGHCYMRSKEHVDNAVRCILQCSRSEVCRQAIINNNLISYCTLFCKKYVKEVSIVRSVLKLYNWVTTSQSRMELLCDMGCIGVTMRCMHAHPNRAEVLAPGMFFLTRAGEAYPPALEYMLEKQAVPLVISALRALHSEDLLQLKAHQLIHTLSKSEDGWKQIEQTKGGWQLLCQDSDSSNTIIHSLPGDFQNPGWCIGETPFMTTVDEKKLSQYAGSTDTNITAIKQVESWTVRALQDYMGVGVGAQTLDVNLDKFVTYYDLLTSLDLLPMKVTYEMAAIIHVCIKTYMRTYIPMM